jgi:hypothetical protein
VSRTLNRMLKNLGPKEKRTSGAKALIV